VILLDQIAVNAVARSVTAPTEFEPYRELDTPEKMAAFCDAYGLVESRVRLGYFDSNIRTWIIDHELMTWRKGWAK
jgi:hypothetical protein